MSRMSLEERCAQLVGAWFSKMITEGDLDPTRMEEKLTSGIGHITRIAAESGAGPDRAAAWANEIQRFLVNHTRLGIPAIVHEEAVAGLCASEATQFPQAIGLASTWDPDLIEEVAGAIGAQMRSVGTRMALAPVLDVARDARWGRVEETYGEDPELVSRMGVAYVNGLQSQGVAAAAKHFLGYAASDAGFNHGEVSIGPRRLRDVYAAPFRAAINEAGLASVMNAYNEIDGLPCAGSPQILTGLLRDELGFDGVVVADYWSVGMLKEWHHVAADNPEAARMALEAGLDVELPDNQCFRSLADQVEDDLIAPSSINSACRRVLAQKISLGLLDDPFVDVGAARARFDTAEDRALARRAARESMVLLVNDGTLPLKSGQRVVVLGPSADDARLMLGDYSFPAHVELSAQSGSLLPSAGGMGFRLEQIASVTPMAALRRRSDITIVDEGDRPDVAVVVVGGRSGLTESDTSGEFRDASDLRMHPDHLELVARTAESGIPVAVVVIGGRSHSLSELLPHAGAIVMAWLPGEEGGNGLADVLCGDVDASGRLPVSLLHHVGQVGIHGGHHHGGGKSMINGSYIDGPSTPLFPFGHGLSYTTWSHAIEDVTMGSTNGTHEILVAVTNTGGRRGSEVVALFARDEVASIGVPARRLIAFTRMEADPGEVTHLRFSIPAGRLGFTDADLRYRVEPGETTFMVGSASRSGLVGGPIAYPDPTTLPPSRSVIE